MLKSWLLFIGVLIVNFSGIAGGGSPEKHIKKAQKYRNVNKFELSEKEYLKALELDPQSFDAQFELGLLYESAFFDRAKSFASFLKAEQLMGQDTIYEVYYQLAKSYHYFEEYDKAIRYYSLFESSIQNNKSGVIIENINNRRIAQANFAKNYQEHIFKGQVKNLGENVNTTFSEYIPVFLEGDSSLLFTRRSTDNLGDYYWDNQYYEDMYISKLGTKDFLKSESFKNGDLAYSSIENTKKHESVVSVNYAQDTLVVFKKNTLWYSVWKDKKWTDPIKFSKNINIGKYQRHACFSKDGNTLIFSSDQEDGLGGYDLWTSTKSNSGEWEEPKNLGEINTVNDEDSPFLNYDGTKLYFSSKGHEGMGGYDVFVSERVGDSWSKPVNVGTPINSPADDIYFKIADGGRKIYLSSNRKDGFGSMDIYTFVPYGLPKFERCDSLINPTYTVSIDANESVDVAGVPLIYQWELGDGAILYGKSIKHTYKRPGEYFIKLNAIDSLTNRIIYDEELITVESDVPVVLGKDKLHIEAFGPDTVQVGGHLFYGTQHCQVPGDSITNYFWSLENQIIEKDSLEVAFMELGEQEFFLEVISRNPKGEESKYCVTKKVVVVSEEEMNELLANNQNSKNPLGNESTIDIGSNLVDSLFGPLPEGVNFKLENIYFDFDKYAIRKDARETLDNNIASLSNHKNVIIKVVGHTDAFGSDAYNIRLSKKRAIAAVNYLVKEGVSLDRIKATLYEGESNPAVPNKNADGSDNPSNRQMNRRVEFYIVGTLK